MTVENPNSYISDDMKVVCVEEFCSSKKLQSDSERNKILLWLCKILLDEKEATNNEQEEIWNDTETQWAKENICGFPGLESYLQHHIHNWCSDARELIATYESDIWFWLREKYTASDEVIRYRGQFFVPNTLLKTTPNTRTQSEESFFESLCEDMPGRIAQLLELEVDEDLLHAFEQECFHYLDNLGLNPVEQSWVLGISIATRYRLYGAMWGKASYQTKSILPLDIAHLKQRFTSNITSSHPKDLGSLKKVFIRTLINEVVENESGNKKKAAERLGISVATLYRTMQWSSNFENVISSVGEWPDFHKWLQDIEQHIDTDISLQDITDYARAYFVLISNEIPKNENPYEVIENAHLPNNILLITESVTGLMYDLVSKEKLNTLSKFKKIFEHIFLSLIATHRDLDAWQIAKLFWLQKNYVIRAISG